LGGKEGRKMKKLLFFVLGGIFLAGCTFHYVPAIYPIDPSTVPDFKGDQPVCVVNISTASGETLLGTSSGGYKYMGDLKKWTDTAVRLMKSELQKRGFSIRDCGKGTKELRLAITNAQIVAAMGSKCNLELHLKAGNGYTGNYIGNNSSFTYDRASDGAVTRAVAAILNDRKIIEYLRGAE